jgi:putative redox protein
VVTVKWNGDMEFVAHTPSGNKFVMDAYPEEGKESKGPTPVEALLSSIAACSAMDVIGILAKKRQKVTGYRVEVEGERIPPGQWPRPFLSITVRHVVKGENVDPAAVARAIELTDEKYCSVIATLRQAPKIESVWHIEQE